MNGYILSILFVLALVTGVLPTSMPFCQNVVCTPEQCSPVNCECGSYKGSCGCCDFCFKCPGEVCIPLRQHRCTDGYKCQLNNPDQHIDFGGEGVCRPANSTTQETCDAS